MIHDLELILYIVKSKVEKVEASGIPVLSESEDIASARITFKNGCVANVTASRINEKPERKMMIYQADSYISLDYGDKTGFICTKNENGLVKESVPVVDHNALQVELETFVTNSITTIETGKIPELKVSGKKGLEALRLAIKITEEIRHHNSVYNFSKIPQNSLNIY
jgi:predicted dehydrogenase